MRTYFFTGRTEIRGGERVALFKLDPPQEQLLEGGGSRLLREGVFNRSSLLTRIKNLEAAGSDVSHERQALKAIEQLEGPQRSQ